MGSELNNVCLFACLYFADLICEKMFRCQILQALGFLRTAPFSRMLFSFLMSIFKMLKCVHERCIKYFLFIVLQSAASQVIAKHIVNTRSIPVVSNVRCVRLYRRKYGFGLNFKYLYRTNTIMEEVSVLQGHYYGYFVGRIAVDIFQQTTIAVYPV